jgi:hypothetical protein
MRMFVRGLILLALGTGCSRSDDRRFWNLSEPGRGGVPVLLTVTTNLKVQVTVRPVDPARPPIELGDVPLHRVSGAMVGDTIVLRSDSLCLRYEETIQFGEPFKERRIEKVFRTGTLGLQPNAAHRDRYELWCDGHQVALEHDTVKLAVGDHELELRSNGRRVSQTKLGIGASPVTIWRLPEDPAAVP